MQLVQGERLAVESTNIDIWIHRFRPYEKVQLIDLDAAKSEGNNDAIVRRVCGELPCRVGGGIRSVARAEEVLAGGARHVIVSSALFRDGTVDLDFASCLAAAVGSARIIAAVDSRGGKVVTHGWRNQLDMSPAEAVRLLEPYCGEFLYTHVDSEGLMAGTDMEAIAAVKAATTRRLTAAGGITTLQEVAELEARGIDAVVGMAIYTGRLEV